MGYRLNSLVRTEKFWKRKIEEVQGREHRLANLISDMCVNNSNAIMYIIDDTDIVRTNRDRRIAFVNQALSHAFYEWNHSVANILYRKSGKVVVILFIDNKTCKKLGITNDERDAVIFHEYGHLAFTDLVGKSVYFDAIFKNVSKIHILIPCENLLNMYLNLTEEAFADAYAYTSGRQENFKFMISALEKIINPDDSEKYIDEDKIFSFYDLGLMRLDVMKSLENNEEFHQIAAMTSNKKYERLIPIIADVVYEEISKRVELEDYDIIMQEKRFMNMHLPLYE